MTTRIRTRRGGGGFDCTLTVPHAMLKTKRPWPCDLGQVTQVSLSSGSLISKKGMIKTYRLLRISSLLGSHETRRHGEAGNCTQPQGASRTRHPVPPTERGPPSPDRPERSGQASLARSPLMPTPGPGRGSQPRGGVSPGHKLPRSL